ncbi:MAG TPA: amidohydrolase family protein [Vicinamibacteria bacterium]|nr:amidohydrolase family protein [Vicinamibacteria bacterium]
MRPPVRLATALLAFGLAAAPLAAQDATFAITNARVVTVSGPVIERGTVVVARGRIAAVGADVAVPPGATVVDAAGRTLYPGLFDALTSIGLVEVPSVAATVDTTEVGEVNPHAKAWIALHPDSELVPVARANGVTTVLAAPSGGLVSGQSALVRLAGTTPDAMTLKAPAALHVVFPSGRPAADSSRPTEEPEPKTLEEWLKDKRKNQEKALARLVSLFAEAKAYAAEAAEAERGARPSPEPNLALEALAPFARGQAPVVIRVDDEDDIRRAVRLGSEQGLRLVIAGGLEAWRCAPLLKEKDVAVLLKVDRLPSRESDPYDAPYGNAAALHRAGVRFAIVTDDAENVRNLPYEAAMAAAYGLPADAALRAITLSPAEIFGVADRVGAIAPGRDASLFLATGDVLDTRTQVTGVWIDGVAQPLETRHTRLHDRYKDRP